jgi:hypothetical protein
MILLRIGASVQDDSKCLRTAFVIDTLVLESLCHLNA